MQLVSNLELQRLFAGRLDWLSMAENSSTADFDRLKAARARPAKGAEPEGEDSVFNEETYLRFNPDVRAAVAAGAFRSGRDHYERYGRAEGRPYKMLDPASRNRIVVTTDLQTTREAVRPLLCSVDTVKLSRSGGIYIYGWVNDPVDHLDSVDLYFSSWTISFDASTLARVRREDAETALKTRIPHRFGFWGFMAAGRALPGGQCSVVVRLKSGNETGFVVQAEQIEDLDMRDIALCQLATAPHFGNFHFDAIASIEHSIGAHLIEFNKLVSRRAISAPYVESFGRQGMKYRGSIIVCLYGRPEYLFLQNAIFARQAGMQDYEFIYVCNSPEIGETLLKEARICKHIYGLDQKIIILNSNAGFGAANNLAVRYAASDRLLITNPDVFPRERDWITKHTNLLNELPPARGALFGAPLYYDDGSLMHGGMYFAADHAPDFGNPGTDGLTLLRVEHYGKGAPPDTAAFLRPRPVPAVSGAFMSVARPWFEKLGGFTDDYVFGHYEDADLCLKSLRAGVAPWIHDLKLWHLEGKGSARRPEHEGGSLVNRWRFSNIWTRTIEHNLLGPAPAHPAFADTTAPRQQRAAQA